MLINMAAMAISRSARFVVTLSGTEGSPNLALDFDMPESATASSEWRWNIDGTIEKIADGTPVQFAASTQWVIPNSPVATYYLRATTRSGDDDPFFGVLDTWLALTSSRRYEWRNSGATPYIHVVKIEIATDSGGTDIVATGWYGCNLLTEN